MSLMFPRTLVSFALSLSLVILSFTQENKAADDPPPLSTASGVVDKADKGSLSIKPRGSDGKFQKTIALKVTGTSKVSILTPQKRAEKVILTQRDAETKDLVAGQSIAIIYAEAGKDGPVLLSAVAQPAPAK
ncbi:MAG TPA: hypothetical protein VG122_17530 [Gemmata sp.]|nr:hypothetical protein [Gemmata sp.]